MKKSINLSGIIKILFVAYIFTCGVSNETIGNTVTNVLVIVLCALLLIHTLLNRVFLWGRFQTIFSFFFLFCLMSVLWASDRSIAFTRCVTLLRILVFTFLMYNYVKVEGIEDQLLDLLFIGETIYVLYVLYTYGFGNYMSLLNSGVRIGHEINNSNTVGTRAAIAAMLALWNFLDTKKVWYAIIGVVSFVVTLGTGSRTALLTIAIGFILIALLRNQEDKKNLFKRVRVVIGVAVVIVVFVVIIRLPAFSNIYDRFESMIQTLFYGQYDGSISSRMDMLELGWKTFLENPIAGLGIGGTASITYLVGYENSYLHNNYIEILANLGIIGFVIYYLLYFIPLFKLFSKRENSNKKLTLVLIILISILVMQISFVSYLKKIHYIYLIVIWALTEKYCYSITEHD